MYTCIKCNKMVECEDLRGSYKHPFCKACFDEKFNGDIGRYWDRMHRCHEGFTIFPEELKSSFDNWFTLILAGAFCIIIAPLFSIVVLIFKIKDAVDWLVRRVK